MTWSSSESEWVASVEARARPPHSMARTLERRLLLERLSHGLERQAVVLQTPAGFGKTTLLSQAIRHLRSHGVDWAWLTIDPSDGLPSRFLHNLSRALALAGEADRRPWPKALRAAGEGDDAAICATIAQALARRRNRVVLVLDDCHRADGAAFGDGLDRLLRALPDNARIVLAGRSRPRVSLSTLRARGLLAELCAADLSFSRSEAEALLGSSIASPDLLNLVDRCEGWPAPLQLALQLGEPRAVGGFGVAMHAVLREYIEDEVLRPLSPRTRELLVKCAIAPQFCVELGEALTATSADSRTRGELALLAPLLAPLDGKPDWVRTHPLLRDALAAELEQAGRQEIVRLHALAAHWFGAEHDLEAAVRHAGAAGDFTFAAATIQRAGGVRLFIRAGAAVLTDLLEKLPPAAINAAEGLRLARAVVLSKKGRLAEARGLVDEARSAFEAASAASDTLPGAARSDIEHIDDLIKIYEDREVDAETIASRERDVERAPVSDTWMRGWIYNHLTIQLCRFGDLWRAQQAAHSSLACYREEGPTYAQVFMLIHLALIAVACGRIAMALEPGREAENLVELAHAKDNGLRAIAQVPLAEALYAQNDLVGARRRLDFAIPVMAAGEGWVDIYARALETRIRIALIEEGLGAAIGFLDRGYEIAAARNLWRLRWSMDAMRHEVMCRTNLLAEEDQVGLALARDIAAGATPEGRRLTWRERLAGRITLARGALFRNNPAAALTWLDAATAEGEALRAYYWVIPALILRAIAQGRSENAEGGFNSFLRAVAIASPQGVVRPFIDEGRAMSSFVRQGLRHFGIGSLSADGAEFVADILAAASPDSRAAGGSGGLLSEREHEILGLLNHGLANKEIARSVGVSEATVKFHLKNLYGKLGVNSRVAAITVARQQRLLH
ncbi:MAG TPA: LuxR C-terminal-related transcriptional regulator [Roseiarcus sp.]|nr:LuxR C-terminal-related transcriptional regulator [Roseiarcus sp.]